ncbi:MAG TPA: serine/threonine-protein kinase [Kofleriaceae bacterium]|jgi:serine/threonine-protein kinase|nr:serine/threonine-protein kinase [Kofleriaceae bacterium]
MTSEPESPTIKVAITGEEDQGGDRPETAEHTLIAGRYRIGRRIGKGGMGEVMAARDEQVGRDVAIKRMRSANPSPRSVARFLREASVQGRLEHPAIVPVHEIGRDGDGLPFFVMKKLSATSLVQILADKRPLQDVLRAFTDVCLAVEFAHVRGIVHRDLKPDNIMLGDFGEVYILDWGVAKVSGEDDDFTDVTSGSGEHATAAGTAIGTPGYMAPEQVRGLADVDGRADIYTLGCVLFEILAGEALHPRGFHGLESALHGPDARPSARATGRAIPPELDELCVQATHKDRDQRIKTARDLGERVQRFVEGDRDGELRREVASRHLDRAHAAFANESPEQRRTAMREAASAIALDPQLAAAAELVGRLMLEPPATTPPEVAAAIAADDARSTRAVIRTGLWVVLAAILYLPLLYWVGPRDIRYLEAMAGLLALQGVLGWRVLSSPRPRQELVLLANAAIVVCVSRMFGPFLVAPGLGASIAMAMVLTPRYSKLGSSLVVAALMIAACLSPLLLEQLGVISRTVFVTPHGLLFDAPALGPREVPTMIVGAIYAIALIIGAALASDSLRVQNRSAHVRLHLQAWQLRQLVPVSK